MKRTSILFAGLLLCSFTIQAQNFYLRWGLGCAVSTSANISTDYTYNMNGSDVQKSVAKKGGYGSGLPLVMAAGYQLSKYAGFELGIDYFYGFSYKSVSTFPTYTTETKRHGQMLSLVPAVVVFFPLNNKITPYARLGLKLGILNRVTTSYNRTAGTNVYPQDWEARDYGGVAVGVQAACGAELKLNTNLALFGEIQVDGISYAPKHGEYTAYTLNGVDKMGDMTVNDKQWNYIREYDPAKTIPDTQADEVSCVNRKFGNAALMIGIKFNLR